MTWGSYYGTGWGGASLSAGAFFVSGAYTKSSNTFVVVFSRPPTVSSPLWPNDATNLTNISLTNTATSVGVPILTVRLLPDSDAALEYVCLRSFQQGEYAVSVSNVTATDNTPLSSPTTAVIFGIPAVRASRAQQDIQDLYNPQTSGDLLNGGLVVGADGDYVKESGVQLLKKLITRRLVTAPGEFFHLADTGYGAGLRSKRLIRQNDIVPLQVFISEQVKKEPEISDSTVSVTMSSSGVLSVTVHAKLRYSSQRSSVTVAIGNAVAL